MTIFGLLKNVGKLFVALILMLFLGGLAGIGPVGAAGRTNQSALQKQAEVDLNGDGTAEKITFTTDTKTNKFTIAVAGSSQSVEYEVPDDPPKGFSIVAIDKTDKYREIVVDCPGESDADTYYIFAYDGKRLDKIGAFSRSVDFPGDGSVRVEDWTGFWSSHDKYVLDRRKHTLKKVPQEFYYVGVSATVKKTFPMYTAPNQQTVVANVEPGSKVMILLSPAPLPEGSRWYLLKTADNLVGWIKEETMQDHLDGIPWAG
ncbi:MAG: hypothetical protein P4L43_04190 [Syntrophobacteraceae bacterium]|nr:hypothetical protein [Syntrophobacteraceae bacterium]